MQEVITRDGDKIKTEPLSWLPLEFLLFSLNPVDQRDLFGQSPTENVLAIAHAIMSAEKGLGWTISINARPSAALGVYEIHRGNWALWGFGTDRPDVALLILGEIFERGQFRTSENMAATVSSVGHVSTTAAITRTCVCLASGSKRCCAVSAPTNRTTCNSSICSKMSGMRRSRSKPSRRLSLLTFCRQNLPFQFCERRTHMGTHNEAVPGGPPNVTPRTTPVKVGTETQRVTPLGRSLTSKELYACGRREAAATWCVVHMTPKKRG